MAAKEETHEAIQEGIAYKQTAATLECELDGLRDVERMINEQVTNCVYIALL